MGRLLIDYSKNTAPLQKDGGRKRIKVGMSLRYHEPLMGPEELDMSACSLGESRGKVHPPNPSFPLQYLDQVEKELKPASEEEEEEEPRRRRPKVTKQRSRRRHKKASLITFKVPSKAAISKKRFETQKLHHSDSDLSFAYDDDKTHATTPQPETSQTSHTRTSIVSTAETFADESTIGLSVRSAPAASPSALLQAPQKEGKKSLEKTLQKMAPSREQEEDDDEDDSEDEELNRSSSFLPTGLTTTNSSHDAEEDRRRRKPTKKKQQPSLGEWFSKEEQPSRSKTPPRSNRKGGIKKSQSREEQLKKTQSMNRAALMASLADDASIASTSQRSILSSSQRSLVVSQLGRGDLGNSSYPLGPRRMLPKRTRSFDDSGSGFSFSQSQQSEESQHSHASSRTRRGGRRPGNNNKSSSAAREAPATRKAPNRSLSSDMLPSDSFRSLKSAENSFSFVSGSRIRIRRTGTSEDNNEASSSLLSLGGRGRRGRLARTNSCEEMPSLLRPI